MKRYPGMNIMRGMLLAIALVAAACGGEQSVASRSAAAYRDAQAKGTPVGGGHDHGGHGATETTASADHSAHGATAAGGAAMDHSAHGTGADAHAGMNHGASAGGAMDHSAHGAGAQSGANAHAAMGHGTAATNAHAGHGTTGGTAATDHAAMSHGSSRGTDAHAGHTARPSTGGARHDQHAGMQHTAPSPAAADPHAQHRTPAATVQADHSQHGAMQTPAAAGAHAHAQHGAAVTPVAAVAPAPRSNADMQRMQPAATLRRDAFDAPAPVSVSEAAKAAQGGGHEGHGTRGITAGEDHENPPTPMPATRDGSNRVPAAGHSQHRGTGTQPGAATVYICPMHPEVTSDKPGTCPKCGMALVKKNG